MAAYEARLATFADCHWKPRGHAHSEALATYRFSAIRVFDTFLLARCDGCTRYKVFCDGDYNHNWAAHHDRCPFRKAAHHDYLSVQIARCQQQKTLGQTQLPEKPEPAHAQNAMIHNLLKRNRILQGQVDALKSQNRSLLKKLEETQALEKEVQEYASVKTALRAALGL